MIYNNHNRILKIYHVHISAVNPWTLVGGTLMQSDLLNDYKFFMSHMWLIFRDMYADRLHYIFTHLTLTVTRYSPETSQWFWVSIYDVTAYIKWLVSNIQFQNAFKLSLFCKNHILPFGSYMSHPTCSMMFTVSHHCITACESFMTPSHFSIKDWSLIKVSLSCTVHLFSLIH